MPNKKVRLQFEVPRNLVNSLDEIAKELGVTRAEVFRDGMGLLFEYVERTKLGYTQIYENPDDPNPRVEVILPRYKHLEKF